MLDKTKPIFDSREAETFDLYDSSDDYGMAKDIDVNEVVDQMESIDDGINETFLTFWRNNYGKIITSSYIIYRKKW